MGASIGGEDDPGKPVSNFDAHIPLMLPFHQRYMVSNKVCRLWADMARGLDLEWIVPQHGAPFKGRDMISRFIDWVASLECGIDLMSEKNYRL